MSTPQLKLVKTNIRAQDLVMDIRGGSNSRYYCLPPFHGAPQDDNAALRPKSAAGGGYPFHLVAQGHIVGVFDSWPAAKASLSGYPDSSNAGYHSLEECVEAWQRLCPLGIHPHPVDPAAQLGKTPGTATNFVNTSPRKIKREGTPGADHRELNLSSLIRIARDRFRNSSMPSVSSVSSVSRSTPPSPQKKPAEAPHNINFVIRGAGIVSSSAARSEERYLELQRRGEEPDILLTRNFERATRFALEEVETEGAEEE
ncbi:hypothetical protein C8F04DRAFT_1195172 [Mycena alexandri]|uniref:Ribonuclease H1 N-terminal domain-containing protein n=1 Tax=Mycena alexandri TaxID=1745969 RepID=A0AAD6S8D1_9AGAR|nr:hypothetical protein C8F04DRAFT_1195172 [Mycena alexandri]